MFLGALVFLFFLRKPEEPPPSRLATTATNFVAQVYTQTRVRFKGRSLCVLVQFYAAIRAGAGGHKIAGMSEASESMSNHQFTELLHYATRTLCNPNSMQLLHMQ